MSGQQPPEERLMADAEALCCLLEDARASLSEALDLLERAMTWDGRLNEAEQVIVQGDHERWATLKVNVQEEREEATAFLATHRGETT